MNDSEKNTEEPVNSETNNRNSNEYNNGNNNGNDGNKKSPFQITDGKYILCLAMSAVCAILSSVSSGGMLLLIIAAGLYAFSFTCNNNRFALILPPVCTFIGAYLINGSIADGLFSALTVTLVGIIIGMLLKHGVGYYKVLAVGTVAIGTFMLVAFGYSLFITYGSLVDGVKTFGSELYGQYMSAFSTLVNYYTAEAGTDLVISEDMIKETINEFVKILPGLICVLFSAASALCIGVVKLCTKIFMKMKIVRKPLELSTAIFFLISIVIALIFDSMESTEIVGITGLNISLIFLVPLCIEGASAIKRRLMMPSYVTVNGTKMRTRGMPKFFLIAILVITTVTDIVMLPVFVSLYGTFDVIMREVALSMAKKAGRR